MKKMILIASFALISSIWNSQAKAAEDYSGNIGGSYGLSVPNENGTTSRGIYGLQATAKLGSEWGLGVYYYNSSKNETIEGVTGPFNYEFYGLKGSYHFEGDARGVYFGALVGISKVHTSVADTSPTHYGLFAGYDKMLGDVISLGGELDYISVGSSSSSGYPIGSFNTLNFSANLKFWF